MSSTEYQTRNSVEDVWGPRTPYKYEWPTRVDTHVLEEPEKWVQSACVLCSNGCGMDIGVKSGKVVGVRGRAVDRVNKGRLGPKGLHGWTSINHKDRLTHPLIRKHGKLERASWDEALDLIVEKTKEIRKRLTAHGIAFYTSGQIFLEEYYVLAMVGKAGLNTLHMDGNTRLCTATAAASMRESFGSDGQPGSYTDIEYTECIFMVGHNMSATQTVLWSRILDRLTGRDPPKLIVVDPRQSNSAKKATIHLAPRIGTNTALLNGIQHLLFKNGWINDDYISKHVVGLDDLKTTVEQYTPERVKEITGVPVAQLQEAAKIIGTTKSLLSTALQGVYQSNQATASACQINNINLLRGLIGKPGCGVFQMNGQPTAQNNREAGCDGEYPGFRNYNNPVHMHELADLWNIDYDQLPHWGQPTHIQNMLNYIANGSIEMFWISGTNPLVSLPHLERVRELLTKPELFVICQDIFMTESAAIADVVLPAAQWAEKTGCFTNVDRTVHLSHKAVEPPGEARPDLDIFLDFGKRMDFRNKDGEPLMPWSEPEEVFEAWKKLSKGRPCDYSAMTYEKLTGGSGIQWPCNEEHPYGKERLFDDNHFFTDLDHCESFGHDLITGAPITKENYTIMNPNGRAILKAAHYQPSTEEPNEEYPLHLSTGRNTHQFHTRTKTGRSKPLQDQTPEPRIQISEEDAEAADVKDGEEVIVRSRRGAVQPTFKSGAVRIEKISNSSSKNAADDGVVIREQQTGAVQHVEKTKLNAADVQEDYKRQTHLELWLGATYESVKLLLETYEDLGARMSHDLEIVAGLVIMEELTRRTDTALAPYVKKYNASTEYGATKSRDVRDVLFPAADTTDAYEAMRLLMALHVYLSNIEGHLTALRPAAQALWDGEFADAVVEANANVTRMQAWAKHQITVRSPQTLIVPSKVLWKKMR
ncbi:hypothetical protein B0A49_09842 [Cryomyces minteri]|uniref:4Fe-4S Mo/W bis-MGD-type domain-containing protein n=1 Tax=Cryomyces minteri TaxID=331657 RepID=A0A4U0WSI3_9PEZI|nr:hypothetical protein B0A49_09454 [Cryomyces minteri]TKA66986.1 hypothetical protein B0A49_09842 [Cryomyces minteri]